MSSLATLELPSRPFLPSTSPGADAPASPALLRKVEALRALSLFGGVGDADLRRLAEPALLRSFEARRTIASGNVRDNCVILVEGRAKTVTTRGTASGELALEIFDAGSILSELCWSSRWSNLPSESIALERCRVLFLPRRCLDAFLLKHPAVALRFLEAMSSKLERARESMTQISCLDVGDRLYQRLLELAQSRGSLRTCGAVHIDLGLHQSELAASIGASREAVNRQLAAWRDLGLIEPGRRRVVVKDPLGLSMAVSDHLRSRTVATAASAAGGR